jgi:hypothetical protein
MTHTKQQIITILENPAAVDAAIIILANNQTAGELRSKSTHIHNGEGFSAAYGKVGTRFYEFVTGIQMSTGQKKWPARSLSHPKSNQVFRRYRTVGRFDTAVDYARHIALIHWKQLGELFNMNFDVPAPQSLDVEPKVDRNRFVQFSCQLVRQSPKAFLVNIGGTEHWMPRSKCAISGDTLSIPQWLAEAKGLEV